MVRVVPPLARAAHQAGWLPQRACSQRWARPDASPLSCPVQDGTPTSKTFEHVTSEIGAEEAEEVGVEHLLR